VIPRWIVVALVVAIGTTGCGGPADEAAPATASEQSTTRPAAPSTQPAEAAVLPESRPLRVQVASIGVDSGLLALDLLDDGSLEVPPDGASAGWYTGSPTPGELGPSVIAGHVDWAGTPGVFYRLRDLKPGDEVSVFREDHTVAVFRVTRVEQFAKDEFPTETVYGDIDHAGLRLITCGGSFDRGERSYDDNIVVFAEFDRVATA
jgi:LPXTG-site transpeptidase (sortase) family protein